MTKPITYVHERKGGRNLHVGEQWRLRKYIEGGLKPALAAQLCGVSRALATIYAGRAATQKAPKVRWKL